MSSEITTPELVAVLLGADYRPTVNDLRAIARGDIDPTALPRGALAALIGKVNRAYREACREVVTYAPRLAMLKLSPNDYFRLPKPPRFYPRFRSTQE